MFYFSCQRMEELFPFASNEELYVLVALARKKHNPQLSRDKDTVVLQRVVRSPERWCREMELLKAETGFHPLRFQLYVRYNPASCRKAYRMLKERFAEWDYNADLLHIRRIDREWISLLQKPEAVSRRQYYLVDIDCKEVEVLKRIVKEVQRQVEVVESSPTFGGMHLLVLPFDVRRLEGLEVEVKKDALFAIGYVDSEVGIC